MKMHVLCQCCSKDIYEVGYYDYSALSVYHLLGTCNLGSSVIFSDDGVVKTYSICEDCMEELQQLQQVQVVHNSSLLQ